MMDAAIRELIWRHLLLYGAVLALTIVIAVAVTKTKEQEMATKKTTPSGVVFEQQGGTLKVTFRGLKEKERWTLINLLRKNFLYQQARPVFENPDDEQPAFLIVRMLPHDHLTMMTLIHKAGGWSPPKKALAEMAKDGDGSGSIACPHGVDDWRKCRRCLGEVTSRELEGRSQVVEGLRQVVEDSNQIIVSVGCGNDGHVFHDPACPQCIEALANAPGEKGVYEVGTAEVPKK